MSVNTYSKLVSRNYAFISDDLQSKIKTATLCFLGCGLGANIALCATRMGFQHFVLCDDDFIEMENLNRQPYFYKVINMKKVTSLKEHILAINPEAEVTVVEERIKEASFDVDKLNADYYINTIDWGSDYVKITDYLSKKQKKTVINPMNIGFGSLVQTFTSASARFADIIENDAFEMENIVFKIIEKADLHLAPYIQNNKARILEEIRNKTFEPQLSAASNFTAAIVTTLLCKLLDQQPITVAPEAIYLDLKEQLC